MPFGLSPTDTGRPSPRSPSAGSRLARRDRAIVGARSPEQVDGWIGGGSIRPTEDDLAEIATAASRLGVGTGPVHPLVAVA